ncbi:protease synthase and sporulation negative regulatory protein PAI 1 [Clostridium tepidiprofundi DSM 19306]|uniref:Protease synthase and sporulation negative regulatory protein PAI 1 n=1 Tax=Clostridium tepidiprofundi DSM 19306 TaxID=1121338 RepID=A0A151B254_9CLOT|nr:GNAT family N-acetyltransferase [Clostridium tepidiprofundi]KYH34009.1 protease synthase and sporulation negative regulatory protein PAI 1 [Clostridium tepidiprofundi DSM 19306]
MIYIRYANSDDAKELGIIHSQSWKIAYKGIVPDSVLNNISAEKREKYFYNALTEKIEEDALIFVDDKPIGFICIGKCRDNDLDDSYGEIWGIYLLPSYWNQGLGYKLINWGINALIDRGFKNIILWVLKENINACKFYEKVGFCFEGTEKEINIGKTLIECCYIYKIN